MSPIPLPGGSALADTFFEKNELLTNKIDKTINKGKKILKILYLIFIFNYLVPHQLRPLLLNRYKTNRASNHILH